MEIEKAVGEELRACRQRKQISQEQLGFDAAIHRTYVSLIERGEKSPTLAVLFHLCKALDVSPAEFAKNSRLRVAKKSKPDVSEKTSWVAL